MHSPLLDFRLTVTSGSDFNSPCRIDITQGRTKTPVVSALTGTWDPAGLEARFIFLLRNVATSPPSEALLVELGRALTGIVLPEEVRDHLFARIMRASTPGAPVRLRLQIEPESLASLPWEYLYTDAPPPGLAAGGFLCRLPGWHIIRQSVSPKSFPTVEIGDRLRVLVAWANPPCPGLGRLAHLAAEVKGALSALNGLKAANVEGYELPCVSVSRLIETLATIQPHVLHFAGHGSASDGGILYLQDDNGKASILGAEALASLLQGSSVRLVVLSACDTHGIAAALTRSGPQAVIAMQFPLRDLAAESFTHHLYSRLAACASVEEALWYTRQHMCLAALPDWGTPALSLAGDTSVLFRSAPAIVRTNIPYVPNRRFTGRESLLADLHGAFQEKREPRVALVGLGGIGKTETAIQYAHAHMADYPDGVFWITGNSSAAVSDSYAQIGRQYLNVSSKLSTEDQAALARRRLQELPRPALLIFDDVTEETDLTLLPAAGSCRILITSRDLTISRACFAITPPLLDEQAALRLLASYREPQDAADFAAAQAIAVRMGRLPLALTLVASYVDQCDIRYADYPERFNPKSVHRELANIIALSHRRLGPVSEAILALASCFAVQGISPDLLYEVYCRAHDPISRAEFHEALGNLVDYSLLHREEIRAGERHRRLGIHETIREFACERMSPQARGNSIDKTAEALAIHLGAANEKLDWQSIRADIRHCFAAVQLGREHRPVPARGWGSLLMELGIFLYQHSDFQAASDIFYEALEIIEKDGVEKDGAEPGLEAARVMRRLAEAKQRLYDHETSRMEQEGRLALKYADAAYAISRRLLASDDPEFAEYCNTLGYVLKMQGNFDAALPYYEAAYKICSHAAEAAPDDSTRKCRTATCLNYIGMLYKACGRIDEARRCLDQALRNDCEALGERHVKVAIRFNNLGVIAMAQDRCEEALICHLKALEIYEHAYERPNPDIADSLYYAANAYFALANFEEASRQYAGAETMYAGSFGADHYMVEHVRKKQALCLTTP